LGRRCITSSAKRGDEGVSAGAEHGRDEGVSSELVEDCDLDVIVSSSRIESKWRLSKSMVEGNSNGGPLEIDASQKSERMIQIFVARVSVDAPATDFAGCLRRWRSYHKMGGKVQADQLLPGIVVERHAIALRTRTTG